MLVIAWVVQSIDMAHHLCNCYCLLHKCEFLCWEIQDLFVISRGKALPSLKQYGKWGIMKGTYHFQIILGRSADQDQRMQYNAIAIVEQIPFQIEEVNKALISLSVTRQLYFVRNTANDVSKQSHLGNLPLLDLIFTCQFCDWIWKILAQPTWQRDRLHWQSPTCPIMTAIPASKRNNAYLGFRAIKQHH